MIEKAYSISDLVEAGLAGRTKIYDALKTGALKAKKVGARTVILERDLQSWLDSLPAYRARHAA